MDHSKAIGLVGIIISALVAGMIWIPASYTIPYTMSIALVVLGTSVAYGVSLRHKFHTLIQAIQSIQNDLSTPIPLQKDSSEFGTLARMLDEHRKQAFESSKTIHQEAPQPIYVEPAPKQNDTRLLDDIKYLQGTAGSSCQTMVQLATRLRGQIDQVTQSSKTVLKDVSNLSFLAKSTYERVGQASTLETDLSKSITHMHQYAEQSTRVAEQAERAAEETDSRVNGLAEATSKINDVVQLIQDIANQTHLLALNATIEAARAGEAGKGFAVVASEVKNLANQTGKATDDISQQIEHIQEAARDTVSSIGSIRTIIQQVSNVSSTITSSINQQSEWSIQLGEHIKSALHEASRVTQTLDNMASQAHDSGDVSSDLMGVSADIISQSEKIQGVLTQFGRDHTLH